MHQKLKAFIIKITETSSLAEGDCLELIKNIPDQSIDLILTDPPYNLVVFVHQQGTNIKGMRENHFAYSGWDDLPFDDCSMVMKLFQQECNRVLSNDRRNRFRNHHDKPRCMLSC